MTDVGLGERLARTTARHPSRMEQELAIRLQQDQIRYLTQVELPVTTADPYFPLEPVPELLVMFLSGD